MVILFTAATNLHAQANYKTMGPWSQMNYRSPSCQGVISGVACWLLHTYLTQTTCSCKYWRSWFRSIYDKFKMLIWYAWKFSNWEILLKLMWHNQSDHFSIEQSPPLLVLLNYSPLTAIEWRYRVLFLCPHKLWVRTPAYKEHIAQTTDQLGTRS